MCPAECGLAVQVEDGVAPAIYSNPHAPLNSGVVCAKGASGLQMVYNANRIKYPIVDPFFAGLAGFTQAAVEADLGWLTAVLADTLIEAADVVALNEEVSDENC